MSVFIKIWKDPVASKLIASGITSLIPSLIALIPQVDAFLVTNLNIPLREILFSLGVVLILSSFLFWFVRFQLKKMRKLKQLQGLNGSFVTIKKLKQNFPDVERISVVGISSVGKTTLIEHILGLENSNEVTIGARAYIHNFSQKNNRYGALLDSSGQSQSEQNDIALESEILIVLLDHNNSSTYAKIDKKRLESHEMFLFLLRDRIKTSGHQPAWIHILFNKQDLWRGLGGREISLIEQFLKKQQAEFKGIGGGKIEVTSDFFSNESSKSITKIKIDIAKHLK